MYNPGAQDMVDVLAPPMIVPPSIPPPAAPFDELIQQSQWNLQQQEQHLHTLRQVQEANMSRNIAARLSVKQTDSLGLLKCVSFVTMVIINEPVCVRQFIFQMVDCLVVLPPCRNRSRQP